MRRAAITLLNVRAQRVVNTAEALGERSKLLSVEALIVEAGVELFNEAILPRASRLDLDGLDVLLC